MHDSQATAKVVALSMLGADRELLELWEGTEPAEFWQAMAGGQQPYAEFFVANEMPCKPRLFQCTDRAGMGLRVEEIVDFCQDDLDPDDIFILDTFAEVYVWVGRGSSEDEKRLSAETAHKYVRQAPDGRDPECPIVTVAQGTVCVHIYISSVI